MNLIVSDTGPINYLVIIGCVDVLPKLFARIIIPQSVVAELSHINAPDPVRAWASKLPGWAEIRQPSHILTIPGLSQADRDSIALAQEFPGLLLIDEIRGRREAERRQLSITGTVGVLEQAAQAGLLSLKEALSRLRETSCYLTDDVVRLALSRAG